MLALAHNPCIIEHMDNKETQMQHVDALVAILKRDMGAYDVVHHGNNNYSARSGYCTIYFVFVDGKIVGDIWYE